MVILLLNVYIYGICIYIYVRSENLVYLSTVCIYVSFKVQHHVDIYIYTHNYTN